MYLDLGVQINIYISIYGTIIIRLRVSHTHTSHMCNIKYRRGSVNECQTRTHTHKYSPMCLGWVGEGEGDGGSPHKTVWHGEARGKRSLERRHIPPRFMECRSDVSQLGWGYPLGFTHTHKHTHLSLIGSSLSAAAFGASAQSYLFSVHLDVRHIVLEHGGHVDLGELVFAEHNQKASFTAGSVADDD